MASSTPQGTAKAVELGDELGPRHRAGPPANTIAGYMGANVAREPLFVDSEYARGLGLPGVIVPGPMLSAFAEQFLRHELPGWRAERLSVTFRVPTPAGAPLTLRGAVIEHHEMADGERIVCDVLIEHADSGERAVTGTATLWRPQNASKP
jgi:hypothetical protein